MLLKFFTGDRGPEGLHCLDGPRGQKGDPGRDGKQTWFFERFV